MAKAGRVLAVASLLLLACALSTSSAYPHEYDDDDYKKNYKHSPDQDHSYAYYLNHKLYDAFARYYPPTVYPYVQCIEAIDPDTHMPYDYKDGDNYDDGYDGKKDKVIWRAHFGYYSSYHKPYVKFTAAN